MANCNELFKVFNSSIRLSDEKRQILREVRNTLRTRMQGRYLNIPKGELPYHLLEFKSQGSYVMDTIITPIDEDFDLDDGVYFIGNLSIDKRPSINNFHSWVRETVGEDENYANVTDKDTCVRVQYKKEKFHIDLPIYYANKFENAELAHKVDGWIVSNPIKFIAWFESKINSGFKEEFFIEASLVNEYRNWKDDIRKKDAQLRRIVRYLKSWGDNLKGEMPPGIVMTILAAENYVQNERDDLSLKDTLVKIKEFLTRNNCKCPRPTTPVGEDLFKDYSETRKNYLMERLDSFVTSAKQAIENPNQKAACLKWQKHLGDRFPCSLAKDENENTSTFDKPAVI
ncbi:MAG TPA: CBASS cGAMP synthase, partial [Emticicia sp.]